MRRPRARDSDRGNSKRGTQSKDTQGKGQRVDCCVLEVEETEAFVDWVDHAVTEEHRVVLQSVVATLLRPKVDAEEDEEESLSEKKEGISVGRVG